PSYRKVMALHGWGDVAEALSAMARRREWDSMPAVITDEMLRLLAVVANEEDTARALKEKYSGLAHRIKLYRPFVPGERDEFWRRLCAEI
ncbi:MAG: LLM class F420-dependent oxidoreductase, partial [Anaerolineales bacterium]